MSLAKKKWELRKPLVLKHLQDGWSINVSLKKAGISQHSPLHEIYRKDHEFKRSISDYLYKGSIGFYDGILKEESNPAR